MAKRQPSRRRARLAALGLVLPMGLMGLPGAADAAPALPFTPAPKAFEQWLNSQRNWPHGQRLRFQGLAQCLDQTTRHSPYRTPVYTCLAGEVNLSGGGRPDQRCPLQRVSYFPNMKRVRYWTAQCQPAG